MVIRTTMLCKKTESVVTVSLYGVITTSLSAIWLCSKLVSFISYMTSRPVFDSEKHYQKNKCHCQLWHSKCDFAKVGWHKNDDIRWEQNYEISRAFLCVEESVEKLSCSSFPKVVSAEGILLDAIITLKKVTPESFIDNISVEVACNQEHLFVANSLKDAWSVLAPKMTPSRHFVELFCQNLKEKKIIFHSIAEEHHTLLEYLQYLSYVHSTHSRRIMELFKKYCHLISTKDQLQLQALFKIEENILKNNSKVDVKNKLKDALNILNREGIRRFIALDAETVGAGKRGHIHMLARISLVNKYGCIYDKYVNPSRRVTDYRKFANGMKPQEHLGAVILKIAQKEVQDLINDCIIVGHDLEKVLEILSVTHPAKDIRDTAFCRFFRRGPHEKPSLEYLAKCQLGRTIQNEDDSVENACAAMDVYLRFKDVWDHYEEDPPELIGYTKPNERVRCLQETNTFFPEKKRSCASDKLDLRIDGSIELGSDWRYPAVGKVMSKLRQSLRQNDRGVNENNPKVLHYNKNWSDTRHIKHTNNGRLQKLVDNILHKQDDFKFIRQDDRAVNERNPKIPGYNNDRLQKHKHDKLPKEDDFKLPNIDWMQQHKDDTYHKEDDFKFTDNTQHDRHDKLNKHDDFKYSSNEWIQQHKGNKLYKEDIDFKFPDNDWIQKHKDDTLHKVDDFKYTNNIQQYKHDKLHKHDNFKYPTNDLIQPFQGDKLNKEDDFNFPGNNWIQQHKDDKFTDNTQHDRHDKLHKHDDLRDKINDKMSVHWDPDKFDYDDDIGNETSEKSDKRANPRHKRHKDAIVGVTQFETTKTTDHKVKDDERTKEFSVHMFKQTMQVFDSMKRKMANDVMKAKVDEMARSYRDQFGDFVRQQRENSVRTKMGDQRAILHTMDTSNLILQRLVNFLKADMEKANIERSHDSTLQREVDAARNLEYKHVCTKYGYCRSDKGFTNMLQNCIKVLMTADDEKMYRARDALTEVLKTGDYSKLIDSKTDKTFKQKINRMEKKEPEDLRKALRVLLGMLQNLQTPLEDEGGNSEVVRKTAAFYTLLAMWEDAMPGDESNKLEWTDIERSLGDWRDGKRTDILEIIKALERNVNRGFKKIDPDTEVKMKEQIKIIRG